jgi:CRP/FNR family transcriptional regulator
MLNRSREMPPHPEQYEALSRGQRMMGRAFAEQPSEANPPDALLSTAAGGARKLRLLRHGWACRMRHLHDGRRSMLDLYLPGDLVGLDGLLRPPVASDVVVTLTPVVCHVLSGRPLDAALQHHDNLIYVLDAADAERRRLEHLALSLSRCAAEERIAMMLLGLYRRLRRRQLVSGQSFRLPLTQQEIADHVGLTVVHVNRVLGRLRRSGIALVHHKTVVLQDLAALCRAAGEDEAEAAAAAAADGVPPPAERGATALAKTGGKTADFRPLNLSAV